MTKSILGPKGPFWPAWRRNFLFTGEWTECVPLTQNHNCWFFSLSWFRAGSLLTARASQYPALWENKIVPACTSCTKLKVTILLNKANFPMDIGRAILLWRSPPCLLSPCVRSPHAHPTPALHHLCLSPTQLNLQFSSPEMPKPKSSLRCSPPISLFHSSTRGLFWVCVTLSQTHSVWWGAEAGWDPTAQSHFSYHCHWWSSTQTVLFCRCCTFLTRTCNLQCNKISQDMTVWESHSWPHGLSLQNLSKCPRANPLALLLSPLLSAFLSFLGSIHRFPLSSSYQNQEHWPQGSWDFSTAIPPWIQFVTPEHHSPPQRTPRPGTFPN